MVKSAATYTLQNGLAQREACVTLPYAVQSFLLSSFVLSKVWMRYWLASMGQNLPGAARTWQVLQPAGPTSGTQ
jgi:hypothetical protein